MITEILAEKGFKKNKDKTLPIYDKYSIFNQKKANSILDCGKSLWFHLKQNTQTQEKKLKLAEMYTCKDRFCPFCNWRRQMKYSKLIYKHLQALQEEKKFRAIFLTLTVKNCHISKLNATIKQMQTAFNSMTRTKAFKNSILGYLRVLEYTVQKNNADMIHPHFHVLLIVEPSYFDTRLNKYLKKDDFAQMWQKALKVDYVPVCDVRIIKPNKEKNKSADVAVIAEMCKYPMKDTDISKIKDFEELVKQLRNVRNINAGGVLKGCLKAVKNIDDDLINIDNENKDELWIILEKILYNYENKNGNLNYYKKVLM